MTNLSVPPIKPPRDQDPLEYERQRRKVRSRWYMISSKHEGSIRVLTMPDVRYHTEILCMVIRGAYQVVSNLLFHCSVDLSQLFGR